MPFIKFKTDLSQNKFGKDRPGAGSSNQPYMTFPNNSYYVGDFNDGSTFLSNRFATYNIGSDTPYDFYELYKSNQNSLDYPIRGGSLKYDYRIDTHTKLGLLDKQRIQKFLNDYPRGPIFLLKQQGLQLSNPKIETSTSYQNITGMTSLALLENTRVFNNGRNLLAQVGASGTGVHFRRHGMMPLNPLEKHYAATVGLQNLTNDNSKNRLLLLSRLKIQGNRTFDINQSVQASRLGIALGSTVLFQYLGGPGSTYGIGSTIIRRYEDTTKANNTPAGRNFSSKRNSVYDVIKARESKSIRKEQVADFRNFNGYLGNSWGNNQKPGVPLENIYKVGNPGNINKPYSYNQDNPVGEDSLNKLSLFSYYNSQNPWEVEKFKDQSKDIIKFVFEAIQNDNSSKSIALFFRAFLSGISDNHSAAINTFKYFGRAEDFYTYQGVSRQIGFSFKIAPQSRSELKPLYKKLNHLISQTYPDYSKGGIMRAPLIRLTIGDYFYRLAGLLESVNVTIDDNVPWEINYEKNIGFDDGQVSQLPQVINVQCSFKPIQDFLPRRESEEDYNVPFIGDQNWLNIAPETQYQQANIDAFAATSVAERKNNMNNNFVSTIQRGVNINEAQRQLQINANRAQNALQTGENIGRPPAI